MKSTLLLGLALLLTPIAQAQTAEQPAPQINQTARSEEIQQLRAELARIAARLDALEAKEPQAPPSTATATPLAPTQPPSPTVAAAIPTPRRHLPNPTRHQLPNQPPRRRNPQFRLRRLLRIQLQHPARPRQRPARLRRPLQHHQHQPGQPRPRTRPRPRTAPPLWRPASISSTARPPTPSRATPPTSPRPTIYQNIFQAYGTYVAPIGKGLTLDVGKWSSSLGVEGNYTKDQNDYTRSFYFYFLPFYHEGVRAGYQVNDKLKLNYWLVNGTNQSEPTNGFKDELFGFTLTPTKKITWTSNYYLGQEHADNVQATGCTIPEQPGLCVKPIIPAPNGKTHIIDNYVTWQATPKLTLTGEGDYFIQRLWANAAPGESSAPSHLDGGAAYAQYQLDPKTSVAVRGEYMSDRNGLFTNQSQALKEATATYKRSVGDMFDVFFEYRRDFTNINYFRTGNPNFLANHQDTTTVGLVWWYGGKQGAW